jgi:ATP-binding cassette subfamily C (CFTR/MRP) protein 1
MRLLAGERLRIRTTKSIAGWQWIVLTLCSVDRNTEVVMQDIIDHHFASLTVLSVMHRLEHVRRYDKIALLEAGGVVEFDDPAVLLARPSNFAALYASWKE